MSGAGAIFCGCCGCYDIECEHCSTGAPSSILLTFEGITITECVQGEGGELAWAADGDLDAVNGTFCILPDEVDLCRWDGVPITEETLAIYFVSEFDTCEQVIATGTPGPVGVNICRADGKWIVYITAGDVPEVIIFYAEISTVDCRTGGTASNELVNGNGEQITLSVCTGDDLFYEMGTGGSVTLTPCCPA